MTIIKKISKCDLCGKEYKNDSYIRGQISIDHSDDNDVYSDHDIEYKEVCSECTHKIAGFISEIKFGAMLPEDVTKDLIEDFAELQ